MLAAKKLSFKIAEGGNGYGHLFIEFGEDAQKRVVELGMMCNCQMREVVATIVSILESYKQLEVANGKIDLIVAESAMYYATDRFNELKKKEIAKEKENAKL